MSADSISKCPKCEEYQLREYYDIGLDIIEHFFEMEYFCQCSNCDFKFETTHKKQFELP